MNHKNIDIQSESILLEGASEFKAADARTLRNKQTILFAGVYANIVIFIVIVLGVNEA